MKKSFIFLCIVIIFFGIVACPENSSDNPATKLSLTSTTSTPVASADGDVGGDISPIPEPATLLLLASGLVGLAVYGRKKFKK